MQKEQQGKPKSINRPLKYLLGAVHKRRPHKM